MYEDVIKRIKKLELGHKKRKKEFVKYYTKFFREHSDTITNPMRYLYEESAYEVFMKNMKSNILSLDDLYYFDFMIDLLIKEVKYSSLLEINRDNPMGRFIYPFHRMNSTLTGYVREGTLQVDLSDNNLISSPWNHNRYKGIRNWLSTHDFQYDKQNHRAYYYDYINITCAYNGYHSLGVGTYLGNGTIEAHYFDTTKIFPYVEANDDLSFSYNKKNVLERLGKEGIETDARMEQELNRRFYGTDYRLILLYKLCQQKYFMEKSGE